MRILAPVAACLLAAPVSAATPLATLRTRNATFALDAQGGLSSLRILGRECLAPGQKAPLFSLGREAGLQAPTSARWDHAHRLLTLAYPGAEVVLAIQALPSHLVLEVREVRGEARAELGVWGPFPTTLGGQVGETVGVVRDAGLAFGLQALNPRTLGGSPTPDDTAVEFTADDTGSYADLPPGLGKGQLWRGDTARRAAFGSLLQAYVRDRARPRPVATWGLEGVPAPAVADGGLQGSAIALFGGPAAGALATLGAIERTHHLPHPLLDGTWAKASRDATASYLIEDFGEASLPEALATTRRAGLRYLYNSSPFSTWGHFTLKRELFPHGEDGLRACVDLARKAGVRLGVHTLSNFITPDDPYVSPKPDARLGIAGTSALAAAVPATGQELPVASPDPFRKATALSTVRLGTELVRYRGVSAQAPWVLKDCQRGAFGTQAQAHAAQEPVHKLLDHDYEVFLTNPGLAEEVGGAIARVCNGAGLRQISLDGLEGNGAQGLGTYGQALFTLAWWNALDPELQAGFINDASRATHFTWHVATRMNWGEPWYAGFRESQTQYRFQNQFYFTRNLLPRMLGWFSLRPDTGLEDAEWMLARAAGYDAGFALAMSSASTAQLKAAKGDEGRSGVLPGILDAVRIWEGARRAGAFPPKVRAALRDNAREFHLETGGPGRWRLYEVQTERFHQDAKGGTQDCRFTVRPGAGALGWALQADGKAALNGVALQLNGRTLVTLDRPLPARGRLCYRGGAEVLLLDEAWRELGRFPVDPAAVRILPGVQVLRLTSAPRPEGVLKLEVRVPGAPLTVRAPKRGAR